MSLQKLPATAQENLNLRNILYKDGNKRKINLASNAMNFRPRTATPAQPTAEAQVNGNPQQNH
jgi:hypothetical protein